MRLFGAKVPGTPWRVGMHCYFTLPYAYKDQVEDTRVVGKIVGLGYSREGARLDILWKNEVFIEYAKYISGANYPGLTTGQLDTMYYTHRLQDRMDVLVSSSLTSDIDCSEYKATAELLSILLQRVKLFAPEAVYSN